MGVVLFCDVKDNRCGVAGFFFWPQEMVTFVPRHSAPWLPHSSPSLSHEKSPCRTAPAAARDAPTKPDSRTLGALISEKIVTSKPFADPSSNAGIDNGTAPEERASAAVENNMIAKTINAIFSLRDLPVNSGDKAFEGSSTSLI